MLLGSRPASCPGPALLCRPQLRHKAAHRNVAAAASDPSTRPFNEGAAQVKRLLNRDRSAVPDLDKPDAFSSETDDGMDLTDDPPTTSSSGSPAAAAAKAAFAKPTTSPFGKAKAPLGAASPFVPTRERPFKEFNEPSGLSPDMEMAPLDDEVWWKSISLTQVTIAISFILTIGLMVGTFFVVLKMGAIRLNDG
eukprot:CAMPEP_0206147516 /NCGR_PEP_ID=MMETSP1473-20131121/33681_1 /ASSEMBLY_ACC=CAM_ASM_001109 /TAXON_ID=1461547 /ORGANISM="Stichococcus sp, Strain RCC1054" /LENGTH=193 /DNA_ID=CAMNT_0053544473 /DNA_START=151 /DNA_END=732 /DNA_ORIENTATION=-